jgi:TatD DNase family protein
VSLTDTHCHLNLNAYRDDLEEVLSRAEGWGVKRILVPALDLKSSRRIIQLAENHEVIFAAVGVHPNSAQTWTSKSAAELSALISHPKVVGIGEIGLDYYRNRAPRNTQIKVFNEQLQIARINQLPLILHVRNKTEEDRACIQDLFTILADWVSSEEPLPSMTLDRAGVVHSFSGNVKEGKQALELGFFIGITGAVTYKKAENLREVVRQLPLSRLLIETDGPFITPHPFRGKRNEPAHVRYIVDKISEVTGYTQDKIMEQTAANAADLFRWE